jgi:hypothetical protein
MVTLVLESLVVLVSTWGSVLIVVLSASQKPVITMKTCRSALRDSPLKSVRMGLSVFSDSIHERDSGTLRNQTTKANAISDPTMNGIRQPHCTYGEFRPPLAGATKSMIATSSEIATYAIGYPAWMTAL